eukprot:SAG31_NODE_42296_length_272_cov_0.670520_1_plen_24_part_10
MGWFAHPVVFSDATAFNGDLSSWD